MDCCSGVGAGRMVGERGDFVAAADLSWETAVPVPRSLCDERLGLGLVAFWVVGVGTLITGVSFVFGLAGKVEKGPSCTERLLGGLPLSFPLGGFVLAGQALETPGPCRFRDRPEGDLPFVGLADWGSSKEVVAG